MIAEHSQCTYSVWCWWQAGLGTMVSIVVIPIIISIVCCCCCWLCQCMLYMVTNCMISTYVKDCDSCLWLVCMKLLNSASLGIQKCRAFSLSQMMDICLLSYHLMLVVHRGLNFPLDLDRCKGYRSILYTPFWLVLVGSITSCSCLSYDILLMHEFQWSPLYTFTPLYSAQLLFRCLLTFVLSQMSFINLSLSSFALFFTCFLFCRLCCFTFLYALFSANFLVLMDIHCFLLCGPLCVAISWNGADVCLSVCLSVCHVSYLVNGAR